MKKLLALLAICVAFNSDSQNSGWNGSSGIGVAVSTGNYQGVGIGANTESNYFFNDNISIGGRFEVAFLFKGNVKGGSEEVKLGVSLRGAFVIKSDYYFGKGNVKPFVGLMAGYYIQSNHVGIEYSFHHDQAFAFGLGAEAGVIFDNGLRIYAIYHLLPKKGELEAHFGSELIEISRNYATLQINFPWPSQF